jgi:hypothetical protein
VEEVEEEVEEEEEEEEEEEDERMKEKGRNFEGSNGERREQVAH